MMTPLIIIGVLLLPIFYNLLFPFKKPNLENYFSPGQTYTSSAEGITQTVLRQDGNKVYCELKFEPHAIGPPYHMHVNLNEKSSIIKGTLSAKINGQIKHLNPGDRIVLNKGVYHSMYNETNEEVIVRSEKDEDYLPIEFAYSLSQLYPLMKPEGGLSFKMFLKICVLDVLFDSVPFGPPPAFFGIIKKVIKPYARLLGATPYDTKSKPK